MHEPIAVRRADGGGEVVLSLVDLVKTFKLANGARVEAVSGISFEILSGETLGLVGESGCGKTTVGRAVISLPPPTSGRVILEGRELTAMDAAELRKFRPRLQMIFQDPVSALNPRRSIGDIVAAPLEVVGGMDRRARTKAVHEMLEAVGLDAAIVAKRRPHELSGGQCQRVCIARALILRPRLLICDEPVSSLDVSIQAQILNLLEDTKAQFGLTMLFVAHDLAVVKNISDRVAVMYLGRVCEIAPSDRLESRALHPYTQALLAAVPEVEAHGERRAKAAIGGEVPSPLSPPSGCRFRTRCPKADDRCAREMPELRPAGPSHLVACHHV